MLTGTIVQGRQVSTLQFFEGVIDSAHRFHLRLKAAVEHSMNAEARAGQAPGEKRQDIGEGDRIPVSPWSSNDAAGFMCRDSSVYLLEKFELRSSGMVWIPSTSILRFGDDPARDRQPGIRVGRLEAHGQFCLKFQITTVESQIL
jgi:hypothetical protein